MIMKKIFFVITFLCIACTFAQGDYDPSRKWQIGIGGGITKFSDEDAAFIGDRWLVQIPRLNLTVPVYKNISIDGALSFNTFGLGFIDNSASYFSMDGSVRYNFDNLHKDILPYVFVGGSLVDSDRKMTPTFNLGAGLTYWVSDQIGLNAQLYYKHSLESFESMRSHMQYTASIIYAFDAGSLFSKRKRSLVGGACYHNQFKRFVKKSRR